MEFYLNTCFMARPVHTCGCSNPKMYAMVAATKGEETMRVKVWSV